MLSKLHSSCLRTLIKERVYKRKYAKNTHLQNSTPEHRIVVKLHRDPQIITNVQMSLDLVDRSLDSM